MKVRNWLIGLTATVLPLTGTGCIVITAGGWGFDGPKFWTTEQTEQIALDPAQLGSLSARTHNGAITFEGGPGEAYVVATKKTGGVSAEDAEKAMEALEVFVEPAGSGTKVGWRWKQPKSPFWRAHVSFEIKAPGHLDFTGETHNGPFKIAGVVGDVRVVTHNGSVNVAAEGGKLHAETHNGAVTVAYVGDDISILTHNGRISADLSGCTSVSGDLTTHNGGIEVLVGERLSALLQCRTHNGRITCNVPTNEVEISRRRLFARIGDGEGSLDIVTHNGSVRVKKDAG